MACMAARNCLRQGLPYIRNAHFLCSKFKQIDTFYPTISEFFKPHLCKPCRNLTTSFVHHSKNDVTEQTIEVQELSFKEMLQYRQSQAQATVLIELLSKDDAAYAAKLCKDCGTVKNFLLYINDLNHTYLLTEFAHKRSAHKFLEGCYFRNAFDGFPVYSRFVKLEKRKSMKKLPTSFQDEIIDITGKSSKKNSNEPLTISQAMIKFYENNRMTDLSSRERFLFATSLQESMCGMFPYCDAFPFGSSVNGVGVNGSDLDVMLQLYPDTVMPKTDFYFQTKTFENRLVQKKAITIISDLARNIFPGAYVNQQILHARMPIVKMKHRILDIECDISVNNMTAVYMSEILYFCGSLDYRIRPLIFTVKKWAKEAFVTYPSPGSWVTNFSLTLLVLFFLQNRKMPILPPLMKAVAMPGCTDNYSCLGIQYLENPMKWKALACKNEEDLASLLKEFLMFVASFPFEKQHISLLTGKASPKEDDFPMWIQYPMEEDKNVSKNVSKSELKQLINSAKTSASCLEGCVETTVTSIAKLMSVLGCTKIKRTGAENIDVNSFLSNTENRDRQGKRIGVV